MTTRSIRTEADRAAAIQLMRLRKLPFTVTITQGARRSEEQNHLQHLWCREIADQLGDRTAEEVRGHCKLHHAVPILRAEHGDFRATYDELIRPRPYEEKLRLMMAPIDLPATRLMTIDQKSRYLDAISQEFTALGVKLTDPEALRAA